MGNSTLPRTGSNLSVETLVNRSRSISVIEVRSVEQLLGRPVMPCELQRLERGILADDVLVDGTDG
jgi:hypothetical protein